MLETSSATVAEFPYAAELRCLRAELRAWKPVAPSAESSAEIVAALQREARLQARTERRRADQLAVWRMRLFSQSVGTVVSLMLPYVIFLSIAWTLFFMAWYMLGIPWGPGAPVHP